MEREVNGDDSFEGDASQVTLNHAQEDLVGHEEVDEAEGPNQRRHHKVEALDNVMEVYKGMYHGQKQVCQGQGLQEQDVGVLVTTTP